MVGDFTENLSSGGVALTYAVTTNAVTHIETLTATAGVGGPTVFTLTLDESTGAYTFTLDAHLDHPTGAGENNATPADANTLIVDRADTTVVPAEPRDCNCRRCCH